MREQQRCQPASSAASARRASHLASQKVGGGPMIRGLGRPRVAGVPRRRPAPGTSFCGTFRKTCSPKNRNTELWKEILGMYPETALGKEIEGSEPDWDHRDSIWSM